MVTFTINIPPMLDNVSIYIYIPYMDIHGSYVSWLIEFEVVILLDDKSHLLCGLYISWRIWR